MNLLQLILKQMRQRLLGTILTCVSVILGMALATAIGVVGHEGQRVFAQTDYGYDLIVGPKGSALTLVLNTVYHVGDSQGFIPYHLYEDLLGKKLRPDGSINPFHGQTQWAVPYAVGDSYRGRWPIVGTTGQLFGVDDAGAALPAGQVPLMRAGEGPFIFAAGAPFVANRFQAVIGSEVAAHTGLTVGKSFQATHGFTRPEDLPDVHPETWTVVGILQETHTANDRVLFIPLQSFYAISEHESLLEKVGDASPGSAATARAPTQPTTTAAAEEKKPYTMNADGTFTLNMPKADWQVSAVLVHSASGPTMVQFPSMVRLMSDPGASAMAVQPAVEMQTFFQDFLPATSHILLMISALVTVVAGISILVSIYNSVTARHREIAILRALGATRGRILSAVCLEALAIGLIGGVLGIVCGHLFAGVGSIFLERALGTGIAWWRVSPVELLYLPVVLIVSLLAGLVPALKAYSVSVAEHLA